MTVTPDELRALARTTRGAKYGNTRGVWVEELHRRFDSQHEAEVAVGLWRRQQAGEVRDLYFQVRFRLEVGDDHVCDYVADFAYDERRPAWDTAMGEAWVAVVADAKGFATPLYKLKKKLMHAVHGIEVVEL